MTQKHAFSAPIQGSSSGGAYVTVPLDIESIYGKKRLPVIAVIDGVEYRGSLVRMGGGPHVLGVLKSIREATGKHIGDVVEVVFEEDTQKREVEVPGDLQEALSHNPAAQMMFDGLAYSHKREYVNWVVEARKPDTRARRIAQAVELLRSGKKRR